MEKKRQNKREEGYNPHTEEKERKRLTKLVKKHPSFFIFNIANSYQS
jgi:hypothetical protein